MKKFNLILLTLLLSIFSFCQEKNMIDGVVWVVGDEAILRSDVEQERIRAQYEGQRIQGDPYCIIPEQIAIQKLQKGDLVCIFPEGQLTKNGKFPIGKIVIFVKYLLIFVFNC